MPISDQESRRSGESGLQVLGNAAGRWLVLIQAKLRIKLKFKFTSGFASNPNSYSISVVAQIFTRTFADWLAGHAQDQQDSLHPFQPQLAVLTFSSRPVITSRV